MKRTRKEKAPIRKMRKEKACPFCKAKKAPSWRDYEKLFEYLSARSRILAGQATGVCCKHQKGLARAIKHARHLALLPFTTQE